MLPAESRGTGGKMKSEEELRKLLSSYLKQMAKAAESGDRDAYREAKSKAATMEDILDFS